MCDRGRGLDLVDDGSRSGLLLSCRAEGPTRRLVVASGRGGRGTTTAPRSGLCLAGGEVWVLEGAELLAGGGGGAGAGAGAAGLATSLSASARARAHRRIAPARSRRSSSAPCTAMHRAEAAKANGA